jgi:ubiquinone/menaquinone biosynthesis C-methylase UbiE
VATALTHVPRGFVAGVDSSLEMVSQARRRNRQAIRAGRAAIVRGCAERLPFPDGRFTHALSVNAIVHWRDVDAGVHELHRVLAPHGRLALAFRKQREGGGLDPHGGGASEPEIQRWVALLGHRGFETPERREHDLGRETLVTLLARRAGACAG